MKGLRAAAAFLTPLGRGETPSPHALDWFPLVGTAIGVALAGTWWLANRAWTGAVAAAVVVAADLALTGMLHFDGLIDAADGLLPHLSRERRLAVMHAPDAGAFGVTVAVVTLLLRWSSLASLAPNVGLLAGLWCGSRSFMAAVIQHVPYARDDGIASAFTGEVSAWRRVVPLLGLAAAAVMTTAGRGAGGLAASGAALAAAAGVAAFAHRRIGGFTGDVLGAAAVTGETIGLLVAAVRW